MPTQNDIQQTILNSEYALGVLTNNNLILVNQGQLPVRTSFIQWFRLNLQALQDQFSISDYISSTTVVIYDRLNNFVGIPYGATIDPNAQVSGTTIITVPVLQNFNSDKIPFATTGDNPQLVLVNYNLNYLPLYGNNPDLALYITSSDFTGDEQTPPTLTYEIPGDETSNITQILWDFPLATTGYIQISGIGSVSSGTPSGGGGVVPITFTYSDTDLVYDSVLDQWYLPLILPGIRKPFYVSDNGISLPINYDGNTGRLNGFANNLSPQVIQVSLM